MKIEYMAIIGIVMVFLIYMWSIKRKRRSPLKKQAKTSLFKKKKAVATVSDDNQLIQKEQKETAPKVSELIPMETTFFKEKGNRRYWYILELLIQGEDWRTFDFYSESGELTREQLLSDWFFPNNREIAISTEEGTRYLNQSLLAESRMTTRKLMPDDLERSETGQIDDLTVCSESAVNQSEVLLNELKEDMKGGVENESASNLVVDTEKESLNLGKNTKRFFKATSVKANDLKRLNAKKVNVAFISITVFCILAGFLGLIRTYGVGSRVTEVEAVMTKLNNGQSDKLQGAINTLELNQFMSEFLSNYLTISDNEGDQVKRKEGLSYQVADNVKLDDPARDIKREVISHELFNVTTQKHYSTAQYKVSYEVSYKPEGTQEEKTEERLVLMSVDFVEKEGRFSVVALPYLTDFDDFTAISEGLTANTEEAEQLTTDETTQITDFLPTFFKKYAEGTTEELSYMMSTVERLGDGFNFSKVVESHSIKQDGQLISFVTVEFEEVATQVTHKEQFSLKIATEKEQLVILEMTHNLGGF